MNHIISTHKCIHVVYMEEKINGDSILRNLVNQWNVCGNESFIKYTVGEEYVDDEEDTAFLPQFESILKNKYGITEGETVILLIWW